MAFKRSSIANAITFSVSLSVYRPLYRRARFLLLYLNGLGGLARLFVEFVGVRDGEMCLMLAAAPAPYQRHLLESLGLEDYRHRIPTIYQSIAPLGPVQWFVLAGDRTN